MLIEKIFPLQSTDDNKSDLESEVPQTVPDERPVDKASVNLG